MLRRIILPFTTLLALLLAGLVLALIITSPPARAACETVGCYTAECWWIGPHTQRCRRVCQRRCWNDAPRYHAPAPSYSYAQAAYADPGPAIPPELVGLGILAVVAAVIAAIVSAASGDSTAREIAQIERSTLDTRAQAYDAEQRTHGINAYIASEEAAAFERGRRAAEREWEEYSRHD